MTIPAIDDLVREIHYWNSHPLAKHDQLRPFLEGMGLVGPARVEKLIDLIASFVDAKEPQVSSYARQQLALLTLDPSR